MSEPTTTTNNHTLRLLIGIGSAVLLVGILLGMDLHFRGLVWQALWQTTGEETPVGQVRGAIELGGNLLRPPLETAATVPIEHTSQSPYAMNVFLQKEVEEPKIRAMLEMIGEAGFTWLRQEFPWEDIEVDGRGQFTDTRNDLDGDGTPDTISAWDKYDRLVDLTDEYGFQLIVRLSNPPDWARRDPDAIDTAPPDDFDDFVNFAVAVAERYQGRITHYQIWNEPNIYPEWGNQFADPLAYTDMLCRTHDALKAVDPDIVVLSAAIAPTISLDGFEGYQDLIYLQNMYDAGAGSCFDILSAQGYGLFSGPTDDRLRPTSVTHVRHIYYRDIMVANGDAHKPIWISEAAWNGVASADLSPEQITQYDRFGVSTYEENARYMPLYYERAQREWPWVGSVAYWFFTRPDPFEANQSFYYFRMAEPDYSPDKPTFTPLPVYETMRDYITQQTPTLYQGTHQADHWAVTVDADRIERVEGAQFETASAIQSARFVASGTDVRVRLRSDVPVTVSRDEMPKRTIAPDDDWQTVTVDEAFISQTATYTLEAEAPFMLDSIIIYDRTVYHLTPLLAVAGGGAIFALLAVGAALGGRLSRRGPR